MGRGITGLHFHDLRREAGSRLLETTGVSVTEVRDYLGHANVTTTNTYLASSHVRLREALRKRDAARASAQTAADAPRFLVRSDPASPAATGGGAT